MGLFSGLNTKSILAGLAAAGTAAYTAQADGVLTGTEVGLVIGALLAGFGLTFLVPYAKYAKAITATFVTLVGALSVAIQNGGGIDGNEWYGLVAIIATAVATFQSPDSTTSDALEE